MYYLSIYNWINEIINKTYIYKDEYFYNLELPKYKDMQLDKNYNACM